LDRFYPILQDAIAQTNVEKLLVLSIIEYSSYLFKILAKRKNIKKEQMNERSYEKTTQFDHPMRKIVFIQKK